jgi:uncharacterized membrane protein YdjX (TVP38/TMEM64 family)
VYQLCSRVKAQKGNLFFFMLFLRLTPIIPNVIVNLGSPIAGIALQYFWLGTFVGLMPMNFIHISTGLTIGEVSSVGLNLKTVVIFAGISLLALVPTILNQQKGKTGEEDKKDE